MSYDNKIVRGPSDIIEPMFAGNNLVSGVFGPSVTTMFNVLGGNSFYLNGFILTAQASATIALGASLFQILSGPNAGNLVGATTLYEAFLSGPAAVPAISNIENFTLVSLSGLNYRNRSGANAFLHLSLSNPITNANLPFQIQGGQTSLVS